MRKILKGTVAVLGLSLLVLGVLWWQVPQWRLDMVTVLETRLPTLVSSGNDVFTWLYTRLPSLGMAGNSALPWLRRNPLITSSVVVLGLVLLLVWRRRKTSRSLRDTQRTERPFTPEQHARRPLSSLAGGVILLASLAVSWQLLQVNHALLQVNHAELITARLTRAVDQLGSEAFSIRLGGIAALERLAHQSVSEHWLIMEILTAYVREQAPWTVDSAPKKHSVGPEEHNGFSPVQQSTVVEKPRPDIQAILLVLTRRLVEREQEEQVLDLRETNLQGGNLRGMHLERALLLGVNLRQANLSGAHLQAAQLRGADVTEAVLTGADLSTVDLTAVIGLTQAQLDTACVDDQTQLPAHLTRPKPCTAGTNA